MPLMQHWSTRAFTPAIKHYTRNTPSRVGSCCVSFRGGQMCKDYLKLKTQTWKQCRNLPSVFRVLSALAHWSPIFGETDYLPMLVFPFVKLFQNNQLVCFEIVATLLSTCIASSCCDCTCLAAKLSTALVSRWKLYTVVFSLPVNWCQHWFEYFPNPPINMLGLVENVLAHHDKQLLQHFVKSSITSQVNMVHLGIHFDACMLWDPKPCQEHWDNSNCSSYVCMYCMKLDHLSLDLCEHLMSF